MTTGWIRILLTLILFTSLSSNWRIDRRPQFYGDSISDRVLLPSLKRVQQRIVTLHDYFRNKVSPPAANMLSMKWHKGAAKTAQKWAQQCTFLTHDSHSGRYVHNFGSCGQNIFVSTHKVPWQFVLNSWYIERQNFTYGSRRNSLKAVGHYTQMVWASTHKVGCGIAKCMRGPDGRPFYNYVCNYCPIGNYKDRFYKPYEVGNQCGACRGSCKSNRLKLCTNSCNTVDLWSNCRELYKTWPAWLCGSSTREGLDRRRKCAATCTCTGKIYD